MSCVFCSIVNGESPASVVFEDDTTLAFMDLSPVTEGHLLVVPKVHYSGLGDLDEAMGARLWTVAHRLARALYRSELRCEGVNLFLADGEVAFQEVFHVHLHVMPRHADDSFRISADWRQRDRAELDASAAAVRAAVGSR